MKRVFYLVFGWLRNPYSAVVYTLLIGLAIDSYEVPLGMILAKSEWLAFGRPWAAWGDGPSFAFNIVIICGPLILLTLPVVFLHRKPDLKPRMIPACLQAIAIGAMYSMLVFHLIRFISTSPQTQPWIVCQIILIAVAVGITEEFIFRDLLYRIICPLSPLYYLFFNALLFGVAHGSYGLEGFLYATAFGIGAGIARIGGMSLPHLIIVHTAIDALWFLSKKPTTNQQLLDTIPYIRTLGICLGFLGLIATAVYLYRYEKKKPEEEESLEARSPRNTKTPFLQPRGIFKRFGIALPIWLVLFWACLASFEERITFSPDLWMEYITIIGLAFSSAILCALVPANWLAIISLIIAFIGIVVSKILHSS